MADAKINNKLNKGIEMKTSTKTLIVGLLSAMSFLTLNGVGIIDYENAPIWVALTLVATVFLFPFYYGWLRTKEAIADSAEE